MSPFYNYLIIYLITLKVKLRKDYKNENKHCYYYDYSRVDDFMPRCGCRD